ncbi:MAG: biotin transporter BioY, partial [Oscillospiraceae bacterium]|nr:biotin transporter BioY [Oscillospiraceae bacterium]
GLPVFAGFQSGIGYLFGTTGGYLIGFLFTALTVGLVVKFFGRKTPVLIIGMVLGLALCYTFGSLWFMKVYLSTKGAITVLAVLQMCVFPFLIPDGVKIALAIILIKLLHKQIPQSIIS